MSKQKQSKDEELIELRQKFLDIEQSVIKIDTINKLLTAYADECSPEASIISSLISKELEEIFTALSL